MNAVAEEISVAQAPAAVVLRFLEIPPSPQTGLAGTAKRGLDLLISCFAIIISLPLLLLIAALIRLDSKGPIFFRQERIGLSGKKFTVLKFRSMLQDAESLMKDVAKHNEIKDGPIFKWRKDPRITRVGRLLRRSSLDELPQLFNVLMGQMSIVGPRPPLEREVNAYEEWHMGRLAVKPGMTGLWQVSGRSNLSFREMVQLDLAYIDEWSVWKDIILILRTPLAVFGGRGAF